MVYDFLRKKTLEGNDEYEGKGKEKPQMDSKEIGPAEEKEA